MNTVIKELARFLDIPEAEAGKRVAEYTPHVCAEDWKQAKPETPEDVDKFYRETDQYLYELVSWNTTDVFLERVRPLSYYHGKQILEVGAGTGALCISMALNGNEVTYCDINEKNYTFAKQRFADRLLPVNMTKELKGLRDYDIVVAIDLLEHIHPKALPGFIKDIAHCLRDGGFLYHRSNFSKQGDLYPMHYDHSGELVKICSDNGLTLRPNGDFVKGLRTSGVQVSIPVKDGMLDVVLAQKLMTLNTPPGTRLVTVKNKPVDTARNMLAKQLDRDWLFFMDADQTFPDDALERLMSWNQDIVSGLVFQRSGEPVPMIYKYAYEQDKGNYYMPMVNEVKDFLEMNKAELPEGKVQAASLPPYGLLEIDGVSAGCLLINRRVFDALEEPYFKCNDDVPFGEDFYFCRKVQDAGFKIYADPSVLCGHHTSYERGFRHFLTWANKEPFPYDRDPGQTHGSMGEAV